MSKKKKKKKKNADNIPLFNFKHNFFKNFFFLLKIIALNNLGFKLGKTESFGIFKDNIHKYTRSKLSNFFDCRNSKGITPPRVKSFT